MNYNPNNPVWSLGEVKAKYERQPACVFKGEIGSSSDANDYIRNNIADFMEDIQWRENFGVLFLSNCNKVIGHKIVSSGGVSATVADPKIIYQHALVCNASFIVVFHNHPSGSTSPSVADKNLTIDLKRAGEFLALRVLDHLILTNDSYFSFADEGLM
jgi:DNA repair protein RadC